MKKTVLVGALCVLCGYLYASPSNFGANAYMQIQTEGSFLTHQSLSQSYVPFQNPNPVEHISYEDIIKKRWQGHRAVYYSIGLMLAGAVTLAIPFSLENSQNNTLSRSDRDILFVSGGMLVGSGVVAIISAAIIWGISNNYLESVQQ